MQRKIRKVYPLLLLFHIVSWAEFPISINGFVNFDNAFDTRQVVADREGHGVLWPEPKKFDPNGRDINDTGQLSMIPLYTLARLQADGPPVVDGVTNYAFIEGDFRGTSTENASLFRLRRAFADFDWEHTAVRVGKAWHPLYVPECAPRLITYDGGEPPDVQVRVPQIRVTHRFTHNRPAPEHELIFAAASHTPGSLMLGPNEDGQLGLRTSTDFIRRSVVPNIHLQYRQFWGEHFWGASVDYLRTFPRLETQAGFKEDENLDSVHVSGYAACNFPRWTGRMKFLYTQNATAYDLPNGFAVVTQDPQTDRRTYANLRALGAWTDIEFMSDRAFRPGIFAGVHKSLGSSQPLFRDNQGDLILISPEPRLDLLMKTAVRARWTSDPIEIGAEVEIAHADFAQEVDIAPDTQRTFDNYGQALATRGVTNARIIANMYYYF